MHRKFNNRMEIMRSGHAARLQDIRVAARIVPQRPFVATDWGIKLGEAQDC